MKKKIVALGVVLAMFSSALGVTALAFGTQREITVKDGVSVYMNGEEITMTDADGNTVDAFVYNGTTYLPGHYQRPLVRR